MKIIVGLGNPGKQYQNTRHNVGFRVIENLSQISNLKFQIHISNFKTDKKFKSEIAEGDINGEKVILVKPITFMNLSGEAVGQIYRFYNDRITLSDIIVVHDDSDLELGRIKVQEGGASAGHHGIESIIKNLGSGEFNRVRVGIRGIEPPSSSETGLRRAKAMEFVLTAFTKEEQNIFNKEIERAAEAVVSIVKEGVEKTMNEFNKNG